MKEEKLGITVGVIALVGLLGALAWWTLGDGFGSTTGGGAGGDGPGGAGPDDSQPPPDPEAIRIIREATSDEIGAFGSPAELARYLAQLGQAATSVQEHERAWREAHPPPPQEALSQSAPPPPSAPAAEQASDGAGESITNTQEAGVDEGGIVKTHGEHLVVLRRGRLFSTRLGEPGQLEPLSMIDAPPPHVEGGWYDEMLIHGDTIVVVGFNYQQAGTELGFFHIDSEGQITRRETYYLRSNDYYSSANYASRLVGDTLLFYMPYGLLSQRSDGSRVAFDATLPGLRRGSTGEWTDIMAARTIYRPLQPAAQPQLHTVVACDLSQAELSCAARGILGPAGRTFYVSPDAVYVWVGPDWWEMQARAEGDAVPRAVVYRLPLGADGAVGAMRVLGMPVDQFSFKEADGYLNVVVRAEGGGDQMWAPQVSDGDLALLRVPLAAFSDGVTVAPGSAYAPLPSPGGWSFQNRFVGDRLVYGSSTPLAGDTLGGRAFVHDYARRGEPTVVAIEHGVERIDVLGRHAVVIGASTRGLSFSAVSLGETPSVVGSYTREGAAQGEQRSHGFFYRATSEDAGNLGLPIRSNGVNGQYTENGSAGVLFLSVDNRERVRFAPLGTLEARTSTTDDHCIASCADWYGNARPIFYRGRVFALLGYELVEGRLGDGLQEIARTNLYEDQPAVRGSEAPPTR